MTRSIRSLAAAVLTAGLAAGTGCMSTGNPSGCGADGCDARGHGRLGERFRDDDRPTLQQRYNSCVDPCWPDRYSAQARAETLSPFANHVANGQVIDSTVFNGDFEGGTDRLSPGGMAKLDIFTRRRPTATTKVFVQTARDTVYDPAKPADYAKTRADLDSKRAAAVQQYLTASTSGRDLTFDVAVIDPADQTQSAVGPAAAVRQYSARFTATVPGVVAAGSGNQAGGVPLNQFTPQASGATGGAPAGGSGGGR